MIEPCNVLFLCTGNSARSVIAESLLRHEGQGRFGAFSAGSNPRGGVHPQAIAVLQESGYPVDGLRSKSWDEFATPGAPEMDVVITVCDNAAGEACPVWPGRPATAHWGIEDPAAVAGADQRAAFRRALDYLKARIDLLTALPIAELDQAALASKLRVIGREPGYSAGVPAEHGIPVKTRE